MAKKKRNVRPRKFTDAQMKIALKKHDGMRNRAALQLGVSPQALHKRLQTPQMQDFLITLDKISERTIENAESNVVVAIRDGDMVTSRWFLERKGASRGYRLGDDGPPPPPPPQIDRDRHKTIINILVQNLDGRVRMGRLDAAAEAVGIQPSEYQPEPRQMLTNGQGNGSASNGHAKTTVAAALLVARRKTNGS